MKFEHKNQALASTSSGAATTHETAGKRTLVEDIPAPMIQRPDASGQAATVDTASAGNATSAYAPSASRPNIEELFGSPAVVQRSAAAEASPAAGGSQAAPDLMSDEYWKSDLIKKDKDAYPATQSANYWDTYDPDGGEATPRTLETIFKETGVKLLADLETAAETDKSQLKLYRGMDVGEAEAIEQWFAEKKGDVEARIKELGEPDAKMPDRAAISKELKNKQSPGIIPIKGHLGGADQAAKYAEEKQQPETGKKKKAKAPAKTKGPEKPKKVLMEFTLKPGAHDLLFHKDHMALGRSGKDTSVLAESKKRDGQIFPAATGNEGNLPGYIGVKSENHGPFSLNMGGADPTHLLFQLFIQSIRRAG